MTETEQLKKNAEQSKYGQIGEELEKYLQSIQAEIEKRHQIARTANTVSNWTLVVWIVSLITSFFVDSVALLVAREILFVLSMLSRMAGLVSYGNVREKMQEFVGVMKTLYILGLADKDIDDMYDKHKRQKRTENMFAGLSKKWEQEKKEKQEAVYQPV